MNFRIEKDTMGEVKVPFNKYWGSQTERSRNNFRIGKKNSMPLEIIKSFAYIKKAAAFTNYDLGILSNNKKELITKVCDEILSNKLDDQFPLVIWQTGSGTHTNMNINEVIANRSHIINGGEFKTLNKKILHPNDDVNKSQSSNDTYSTAMNIAAYKKLIEHTIPAIEKLYFSLKEKAESFKDIIKIGRTHLMDATPLTLGQEFSSYVSQISHGLVILKNSLDHLSELAIGGTAVGTGLNTPKKYDIIITNYISKFTNIKFKIAKNKFESISAHDAIVSSHSSLKQICVSIMKITNDIRMLTSGPRCGISEILIPNNEPGSSIMPGKVNPTQCEAISMVCVQVIGNDLTISLAGSLGNFELNTYKPVIISNFIESAQLLGDACNSFSEKCIIGIKPNKKRIDEMLNNSLMLVTVLVPYIGYEKSAEIAKYAYKNNITLKKAAITLGYLTSDQFNSLVSPKNMIK